MRAQTSVAVLDLWLRHKLGIREGYFMKTKLILAMCAALLSTAVMAVQTDDHPTETTKTTTTTVEHVNGTNEAWYKQGGVVPIEYRDNRYVVQHWQTEHLNNPAKGSHWVRGDNGDFLLVDESTGVITKIIRIPGN